MSKTKKRIVKSCFLLCMIFLLSCVLFLFAGCKRENKLIFDYDLVLREYFHSGEVELTVTVKNDYGFEREVISEDSEYCLNVCLYNESDGRYEMQVDCSSWKNRWDYDIDEEEEIWISSTVWLYFEIPSDAPIGDYNLILSYKNNSAEYENVLTVIEGEYKFTFDYEIDATECIRGSYVGLSTTITNDSGFTHTYFGSYSSFMADIYLYHDSEEGRYVMPRDIIGTADMMFHQIKNDESRIHDFGIKIPLDAPLGEYNLILSYAGHLQEYENVLTVTE